MGRAAAHGDGENVWQRVESPHEWSTALGTGFCGTVTLRRFFNRPQQLDASERLWLVLDGVVPPLRVRLNGLEWPAIDTAGVFQRDMTTELRSRNALELILDTAGCGAGSGVAAVRLEIRLAE